jgi:class I lanthipeptide synthase
VLMRTSLFLPADPELHKHVERFAAVFGETLVPLHLLFDPSKGIGAPAGYPSSPHKTGEWTLTTETEKYLHANRRLRATLIERARRSAAQDVSLEAEDLGELPPPLGMWPASYDVFTFLDGDDDGLGITIAPIGVTFPAGKAHGRFAYGDETIHRHLFRMADHEKSARPDVILCEIDYINNRANVNNVAITPSVCDYHLKVTTGDFADVAKQTSISMADLLVGVDRGRFYLQHAPDGRQVICRTNNLVTPDASADVVRFVEQVSCDGFIRPGWTWGEVAHLVDFLPGVQFGGVTLSAPTWRIPRLAGTPAAQNAQLLRWADDAGLPDYVWVGTLDNRLLLHLRDRLHRDLLAREAAGGVEFVSQARPSQRLGIARDAAGNRYATEVVFSATAGQARRIPEPRALPRYDLDIECERTLVPGAQWWYLRIYNTVDRQNELLAALAAAADLSRDNWFYVRYQDPDDHLRVRVRADDTDIARLCAALRACVDDGTARWFSIDTYIREVERYGGLDSMRIAERLFCHESYFVARNLDLCPPPETMRKRPGDNPGVDTRLAPYLRDAAELVDQYLAALGLSDERVMQLLDFVVSGYREEFEASSPTLRRAVQSLVARSPSEAAYRAGKILADSLRADAYGLVDALAAPNVPGQRQLSALQSLLHMFINRIGFTRQREYQVMFLLRAIKLAKTHYKELMADV